MRISTGLLWAMLAIAASVASSAAPPEGAKGLPNPFYAMDTAFGGPRSPDAKLDELKALGYAGASVSGDVTGLVDEFARGAEKRGLKLYCVFVTFRLADGKLQVPANLDAVFQAIRGPDTLVWICIPSTSKQFKPSDPQADDIVVPELRSVADRAAKSGIRLAIYPHLGYWVERVEDAVRVARKVDRPNCGVTFNLCHCLAVKDGDKIPQILKDARPLLFSVTISGADAGAQGWPHLIQTLDHGTFDVLPVLQQLREVGYTGPIGFQGYGIHGDWKDNLARTMTAWRRLSAAATASPPRPAAE
jgi:sugar phosphate isomerase/epimerase